MKRKYEYDRLELGSEAILNYCKRTRKTTETCFLRGTRCPGDGGHPEDGGIPFCAKTEREEFADGVGYRYSDDYRSLYAHGIVPNKYLQEKIEELEIYEEMVKALKASIPVID